MVEIIGPHCPRLRGCLLYPQLCWFLGDCGGSWQPLVWGGSSACGSPCSYLVCLGVGGEEDDAQASVASNPWFSLNSPESRPLSAPPRSDFTSLFALSTPESRCPPSVSLPQLRVLICRGGCTTSGSPSGVPALPDFRFWLGLSLFVRSYRVLLSVLSCYTAQF